MKKPNLTLEELLPLLLSAAGAVGVAPFTIIRFRNGDWAVGLLDAFIVVGLVFLGMFVLRTRRVRMASILLAILCSAGPLATVALKGPTQVLWCYPGMLAVFYLLRLREALWVGIGMIAVVVLLSVRQPGVIPVTTIVITMLVAMAFASAFSLLTETQRAKLTLQATRDPLTGTGNRRALEERLATFIGDQRRSGTGASLIMLDLDHFKNINDTHGHETGDRILCELSEIVLSRIRASDGFYRVGGEEFIVFADGDSLTTGARLAEDLRRLVEERMTGAGPAATISLGVAEYTDGESARSWLRRTDQALYEAKRAGRNCTQLAS